MSGVLARTIRQCDPLSHLLCAIDVHQAQIQFGAGPRFWISERPIVGVVGAILRRRHVNIGQRA
jgi:hypothetical protein